MFYNLPDNKHLLRYCRCKLALFFVILCLCFAFAPEHAVAWLIKPRIYPLPSADKSNKLYGRNPCFVMFANPLSRFIRAKESLLLPCDTNNFAPVIRLDASIPLKILSKQDMSPRESLNVLLYADIQMQQLMQELSQLKKKTKVILKDLSIPYLEKKILKKPTGDLSLREKADIIKNKKKTGHKYSVEQNTYIEPNAESWLNSSESAFNSIHRTDELPLLFRAVLGFFRYVIANRFESLFYGIILFVTFYFVSLKIRTSQ